MAESSKVDTVTVDSKGLIPCHSVIPYMVSVPICHQIYSMRVGYSVVISATSFNRSVNIATFG